jgi:hypothetical protein
MVVDTVIGPCNGDQPRVTLSSREKHEFSLPLEMAMASELVRNALCLDGDDGISPGEPNHLDVGRVGTQTLGKVTTFLVHNLEQPMLEIAVPITEESFEAVSMVDREMDTSDEQWLSCAVLLTVCFT